MPGLASARASIFEQNIQKNREAGYDRNILGQKASNSRVVSRRLFAHNKLSDDVNESSSSSLGDPQRRYSSLSSQISSHGTGTRTSVSASATAVAIRRQSDRLISYQSKGQTTVESTRRPDLKPSYGQEQEINFAVRTPPNAGKEKISKNFPFKDLKKRASIKNLADHLNTLDIKSLQSRGDGDMNSSRSSLEEHRDRFKLPDFRVGSSHRRKSTTIRKDQMQDDSLSSLGSLDNSGSSLRERSISCMSLNEASLDNSSSHHHSRVRRSNTDGVGGGSSSSRRTSSVQKRLSVSSMGNGSSHGGSLKSLEVSPPSVRNKMTKKLTKQKSVNKSLAQHFAANNSSRNGSWIQPSSITEDDDSCSSSHHSQPFKSVPFAKSTIKRHGSVRNLVNSDGGSVGGNGSGRRESGISRKGSNRSMKDNSGSSRKDSKRRSMSGSSRRNNSSRSINSTGSSHSRKSSHRRRSGRSRSGGCKSAKSQRQRKRSIPPAKADPVELALQEEIEALRRQIEASEAALAEIEKSEEADMKKVQATKERKLRRIENSEKRKPPQTSNNNPPSSLKAALAASASASGNATTDRNNKEEAKSVKIATRQLKQQNAKLHDEIRKMKVEASSLRYSNRLLKESTAEIKGFHSEIRATGRRMKAEQDQYLNMVSLYKQSIMEVEKARQKKGPAVQRVKGARMQLEDKIDIIVSFMQNKCSDFELVEELTILAGFDESGWEDTKTDEEDEYDSEDDRRASYIGNRYDKRLDSDEESPRSVSDLLMPTSSHSFHLFVG